MWIRCRAVTLWQLFLSPLRGSAYRGAAVGRDLRLMEFSPFGAGCRTVSLRDTKQSRNIVGTLFGGPLISVPSEKLDINI